jgi:NAD(P)H-hydrate repair Nnr-like enzyme with NAD(P)H-hydrate epimerase domain
MDAVKLHLTVDEDVTTYLIDQHGLRPEGDAPLAARLLHRQTQTIVAEWAGSLYDATQAVLRVQKALQGAKVRVKDAKLLAALKADLKLVVDTLQAASRSGPTKEIDITVELDA